MNTIDEVAANRRNRLEVIEEELVEVRRLLDRIRHVTETTDLEISGHTLLNNERAERQEKMENISQEARTLLT